jgi:Holliday junction resolvase RusA-like endonuclease
VSAAAPPRPDIFVRPVWKATLETGLSYSTRAVMSAYRMAPAGHPEFYVQIPGVTPSANKLYGKRQGGGKGMFWMDPAVRDYRSAVDAACWRKQFVPRGTVGAVLVFESPNWVTKKHLVRSRDLDNPVKTVLDALQLSLQMRDELVWEMHTAKLFGRRDMTHVWLFDLGDVIPALGAQSCLSQSSS